MSGGVVWWCGVVMTTFSGDSSTSCGTIHFTTRRYWRGCGVATTTTTSGILTPHPQLSLISHNLSLAAQLRQALFSRPASADYTSDQRALREAVWPVAR